MRPRRAYKLASLGRPALLEAVAEGMGLLVEHVGALERAAERLRSEETPRGVEAITAIADEEAGKFLILLDVARCAYLDAAKKRDQLKRCADHIAKGIYARVADIRPADFSELVRYVDLLRRSYYLDGPNDVDWLFRNEIMAEREERLYVDYVETDEIPVGRGRVGRRVIARRNARFTRASGGGRGLARLPARARYALARERRVDPCDAGAPTRRRRQCRPERWRRATHHAELDVSPS